MRVRAVGQRHPCILSPTHPHPNPHADGASAAVQAQRPHLRPASWCGTPPRVKGAPAPPSPARRPLSRLDPLPPRAPPAVAALRRTRHSSIHLRHSHRSARGVSRADTVLSVQHFFRTWNARVWVSRRATVARALSAHAGRGAAHTRAAAGAAATGRREAPPARIAVQQGRAGTRVHIVFPSSGQSEQSSHGGLCVVGEQCGGVALAFSDARAWCQRGYSHSACVVCHHALDARVGAHSGNEEVRWTTCARTASLPQCSNLRQQGSGRSRAKTCRGRSVQATAAAQMERTWSNPKAEVLTTVVPGRVWAAQCVPSHESVPREKAHPGSAVRHTDSSVGALVAFLTIGCPVRSG